MRREREPRAEQPASLQAEQPAAHRAPFRPTTLHGCRAIGVGACLVVLLSALTLHGNLRYGRYITASSLPSGAVFMFVAALLANAVLLRLRPRLALTAWELALVFAMLYISAALPQASVAETLVTLVAVPAYFPKPSPYLDAYSGDVPSWLLVRDARAIRRFYEGLPSGGGSIDWSAWIPPLLGWGLFVTLLITALYCLSRLFNHRWVAEERVSFPLMELPLELLRGIDGPAPIWRNARLYLGASIPAATILMGLLHGYLPTIPGFQQILSFPIGKSWVHPPLNALDEFTISIWPMVVGISYMITSEVAVSIWGFHLLFWGQVLLWSMAGYSEKAVTAGISAFSPLEWIHAAEFGGAIVIAASLLWTIRREAIESLHTLLRREPSRGPVSPWTTAGFLAANAGMLVWGWAAGRDPIATGLFLLFLYAIVIALSRMVAAGGLYLVDNGFTPQSMMHGLAGVDAFGKGAHYVLTGQEALFGRADMSFLYFATNDGKLARETGSDGRWHAAGIVIAVAAALVSACYFILLWGHAYGAETFRAWPLSWNVPSMYGRMSDRFQAFHGIDPWTYAGVGSGIVIAAALLALHRRTLWWPLSPFGFVIASSWNINYQIWSSVLIGWAIASVVKRYGGLSVYRSIRPFFLGLILGDAVPYCTVVLIESLVGVKSTGV